MLARVSALSLLFLACSGPELAEVNSDKAPPASGRYGLVVLAHAYGDPGVSVSGQFMAFEGFTREAALHALAPAEDVWLLQDAPEPGHCRFLSVTGSSNWGAIDLLSAGTLSVRPPEPQAHAPVELFPRTLPAVVFSVSGHVYDAEALQDLPFLSGGTYRIRAPGAEVGEVFAQVVAPDAIRLSRLGGDLDSGLSVAWRGDPSALLTISRDVGARTVALLCSGEGGRTNVSPGELALIGPGLVQVSVAKVRRASTTIAGLDEADVLFVSRDTIELRLGTR